MKFMKPVVSLSKQCGFVVLLLVMANHSSVEVVNQDTLARDIAMKALNATVKIKTEDWSAEGDVIIRNGSGVIISPKGLIVTNYHNILNAENIEVKFYNGYIYSACMLQYNKQMDIALVQVDASPSVFFELGEMKNIRLGEKVFAIGSPADLDFSLTSGIIGGFNRQLNVINAKNPLEDFIQTDVVINHGCSGGPLFNRDGKLVGINTAIATKSGRFEGYSLAQPVTLVKQMLLESGHSEL